MASKKSKALKKRAKAEKKLAKARAKYGAPATKKWYKNPDWIRAIAAIIAIVLTLIGLLFFR